MYVHVCVCIHYIYNIDYSIRHNISQLRISLRKQVFARGSLFWDPFKIQGLGIWKNETSTEGHQSKNALLSWFTAMDNQGLMLLGH